MASPTCPRCDYDLSGLVAAWTGSCPMQAVCSECGLSFDCSNVLSPRRLGPGWSFEHAPRPALRRWVRTSLIAINPWLLSSRLRIDHAVRAVRLVGYVCAWLLLVHSGTVALRVWAALTESLASRGSGWLDAFVSGFGIDPRALLETMLIPYTGSMPIVVGSRPWTSVPITPLFTLTFVPTLLMPLWMTILGTTFAEAKVRRIHLLRGLAYSLPGAAIWTPALMMGFLVLDASVLSPPQRDFAMGALALAFPLYHLLWWWCFIRRYLRLRHALATVVLMMIMSGLVGMIVLLLMQGRMRYGWGL